MVHTTFFSNSSSLLCCLALNAAPTGDQVVTFLITEDVPLCRNTDSSRLQADILAIVWSKLFSSDNRIHTVSKYKVKPRTVC